MLLTVEPTLQTLWWYFNVIGKDACGGTGIKVSVVVIMIMLILIMFLASLVFVVCVDDDGVKER